MLRAAKAKPWFSIIMVVATIPIATGMVTIAVPIILCDLHSAVFGRRSPLIIRGFQNSRGVHGPIDCIGRHGRLRRGHSRNRTNCRYQTYDCLIHTLLLWVTGSTGPTDITTNVLAPPLSRW